MPRCGPQEGAEVSFIFKLLFLLLLFPLLFAFLTLLCKDSFFFSLSHLLGGDGQVSSDTLKEGRTAHGHAGTAPGANQRETIPITQHTAILLAIAPAEGIQRFSPFASNGSVTP